MRKVPVIPAALLVATFAFTLPSSSEGRTGQKSVRSSASVRAKKPAAKVRAKARSKKPSVAAARRASPRRSGKHALPARATAVRKGSADVDVIHSVEIAEGPAHHGPFLPREAYDYPRLPCPPVDPVITAELHEPDSVRPETPATQTVAESFTLPPRLARLARRVGSLFRPKSAAARVKPQDVDLADLLSGGLQIPVEGVDPGRLRDSFLEERGRHARHLAIDIGAPRGTPILATADGEILKLTREARGGITIYQKDSTGRYLFFYGHLSRYASGLETGQKVSRGEVIGYVGSTGRVIGGPHLHFSITRLPEDDDNFREGLAINPYLLFLAGVP
ncbi:MAG: M23 family metallopeptidase [Thermoanaerobaculia bacterium]